jgi:DNA-binding response OmpR family regulator
MAFDAQFYIADLTADFKRTDTIEFGPFRVTKQPGAKWETAQAFIGNREVDMKPSAKKFLAYLISQHGRPLSHETLRGMSFHYEHMTTEQLQQKLWAGICAIRSAIRDNSPELSPYLDRIMNDQSGYYIEIEGVSNAPARPQLEKISFGPFRLYKKPGDSWSKSQLLLHEQTILLTPIQTHLFALMVELQGHPLTIEHVRNSMPQFADKTNDQIACAMRAHIYGIRKNIEEQVTEPEHYTNLFKSKTPRGRHAPTSYYISDGADIREATPSTHLDLKTIFAETDTISHGAFSIHKKPGAPWPEAKVIIGGREIEMAPILKQYLALLISQHGAPLAHTRLHEAYPHYADTDPDSLRETYQTYISRIRSLIREQHSDLEPYLEQIKSFHRPGPTHLRVKNPRAYYLDVPPESVSREPA